MEEIKLTPKQKAFCDYYIENGGNATEAAIKAGYSETSARQVGSENLSKPYIVEYIKSINKTIQTPRIASMVEVKEFWTDMLRDERNEPKDRLKASEYIAKVNGAFIDKVQHTGSVEVVDPLQGLSTEEIRKIVESMD